MKQNLRLGLVFCKFANPTFHNGCFWEFVICDKSQFQVPTSKKSEKVKSLFLCDLAPLFFLNVLLFYSLAPKIEICLKYFLDKNSQKPPLCIEGVFFKFSWAKQIQNYLVSVQCIWTRVL